MSTKATQMPLCRLMSKRGIASRAQATAMALAGKVSVDGRIVDDPERWVGHCRGGRGRPGQGLARAG